MAFKCFQIASSLRNPVGIFNLATSFLHGIGHSKDVQIAERLFNQLFEPLASYGFAQIYKISDPKISATYLLNNSKYQHPHSLYELALFYEDGIHFQKNSQKAILHYLKCECIPESRNRLERLSLMYGKLITEAFRDLPPVRFVSRVQKYHYHLLLFVARVTYSVKLQLCSPSEKI